MIALYNPKVIKYGEKITANEASIKNFVWSHARWSLAVNELKKFPDEVGEAMLKHFQFLVRVTKGNHEKIETERKEKKFKCEYCEFETNTKVAFISHVNSHKESRTNQAYLDEIEDASAKGDYKGAKKKILTPDEQEGIPGGGTKREPKNDKDGVGWYGSGLTKDSDGEVKK